MRKVLSFIICMVLVLTATAFAVVKSTPAVKAAKMHATGKVIEISNEQIKIERTVKGDIETMEFALDKSSSNISTGDSVKIEYTEKDGKLTASKVSKVVFKNRNAKPSEMKSVPVK